MNERQLQKQPIGGVISFDWASEFAPELRVLAEKKELSGVKIEPTEVIVVAKKSKYELDQDSLQLRSDELIRQYQNEGIDPDAIIRSHLSQLDARIAMETAFGKERVITRDEFLRGDFQKVKAVIALGGDNHFQFVAQHLSDVPIIGVNSDASRSEGALTYFQPYQMPELIRKLKTGEYFIEQWRRISVTLNNQLLKPAVGEVFFGQKERASMSRHILEIEGIREEQKGSGILVSTGAGSTGWYDSAIRYLHRRGDRFPKTAEELRFVLTEPYWGKLTKLSMITGSVALGTELKIDSLNDAGGVMILDSLEIYPFHRGAKASIKISDNPLNVISRAT